MAGEKQTQRMKIKILEVKERQPIGDKGAVKLAFKAEINSSGFWFFTFSPSLFEAIESSVGKWIEVDVTISEREVNGNTYVDRKVTQVYIDGKPVKTSSGSRGYNARDEDRTDARCAAMEIGSCWREGKLLDTDPLVGDYKSWLSGAVNKTPAPAPKPDTKKAETKQAAAPTGEFKNAGEFLKACLDQYNLNRTQVLAELNASTLENIDLKAAWQTIKGPRQEKP